MQPSFFAFVAFLGGVAFLSIFIADREKQASLERLSNYEFPHHAALDADPGLKLFSASNSLMRTER
jgi:hypothetical protein